MCHCLRVSGVCLCLTLTLLGAASGLVLCITLSDSYTLCSSQLLNRSAKTTGFISTLKQQRTSDPSIPSSSYAYPVPLVSTYAFRAGVAVAWAWGMPRSGMPLEITRRVSPPWMRCPGMGASCLMVYLLWGRPSFLRRRRPDQYPPPPQRDFTAHREVKTIDGGAEVTRRTEERGGGGQGCVPMERRGEGGTGVEERRELG